MRAVAFDSSGTELSISRRPCESQSDVRDLREYADTSLVTRLPTGTVTLLFTDIEGSTRLLRELGDGYPQVLAGHRRALRAAFAHNNGVEVDAQGDAFFAAFV